LVFNYSAKYTKNLCLAILLGLFLLIPGAVVLYKLDFITFKYATDRVTESNSSFVFNLLNGIFDTVFQLLNFIIAIVVILYLWSRKKIVRQNNKLSLSNKAIIYTGLTPYVIFCLLEVINGPLPTEWLVCATTLILPAVYVLLKLRLKSIAMYKLITFAILVNAMYFIIFNINSFVGNHIEHNNIGKNIAVTADSLIKENSLPYPNYASGSWDYGLYLTVFMKHKPVFVRKWFNLHDKGVMLMVFPGCGEDYAYVDKDISVVGYKVLFKKCDDVELTDKLSQEKRPFTFYLVENKKEVK